MKQTSKFSREELEAILREKVDWRGVHRYYVFCEYGTQIHVHYDGSVSVLNGGERFRDPDAAGVVYSLRAAGGNVDGEHYCRGWAEPTEDGNYLVYETGEVLDEGTMIARAIERGDEYENWIEEALWRFDEDRRERERWPDLP
jgi:hypothetical protein